MNIESYEQWTLDTNDAYSQQQKIVNVHSICHWRRSLDSDVSDYFFWSEYRVNRTRLHSLSSEFSLYLS